MSKDGKPAEAQGFFGKLKNTLASNWGWPVMIGTIAAIAISGPVGLGVGAGLFSASKLKNPATGVGAPLSKAKEIGLKVLGASVGAGITAACAAIGTLIFPVVGTFLGAVIGAAIGAMAAKKVTEVVRDKYIIEPKAKTSHVVEEGHRRERVPELERGQEHQNVHEHVEVSRQQRGSSTVVRACSTPPRDTNARGKDMR